MTVLEILHPRTAQNAQQRGWQYLNRVHALAGDAHNVTAQVRGSETYDVEIRYAGNRLRVWCSCPYFADRSSGCKHLWATAVLAIERGWLTNLLPHVPVLMDFEGAEHLDFGVLDEADQWVPRQAAITASPVPDWAVALAAVTPPAPERATPAAPGSQLIYVLTGPDHGTTTEVSLAVERIDRTPDGTWSEPHPAGLTPNDIPHLPSADDRWALSVIHAGASRPRLPTIPAMGPGADPTAPVYLAGPLLEMLLPRLCATGRVRVRYQPSAVSLDAAGDVERTLRCDDGEPWTFVLVVSHETADASEAADSPQTVDDGVYRVTGVLTRGDVRASVQDFTLLTDTLAFVDDVVSRFDPAGGFAWAAQLRTRGALVIPATSRRALIESIARSAVQHVEVPDHLRWAERIVTPRFGVRIGKPNEHSGACPVEVYADYDGTHAPADRSTRLLSDDGSVVYRRDVAAEQAAVDALGRLGVPGLEAHRGHATAISYKKVPALVRALLDEGWMVQAEGVRYRALQAPRLQVRSGIDWFGIHALGDADTDIDVADLLRAVRTGRRTVMLGDGTIGMLPEEWLARVAPVLALGEPEADGIRFKPSQVALVDALLASQPGVDWDEAFVRAREVMRQFDGVHPDPAPSTFNAELRDYQREALGWMRLLRELGFGGCLADDMGLGKTVMVLAMLEVRRTDPAGPHGPSLVVVPRSLVFNWASEAARFAPGLRVLDFAGADRHQVADRLADADVVLTTYGTLRRDVLALKDQPFDYVVLDEAQAIKNAATATARSVRLLQARHRLALTGTPVENHLGELQSLFDFLNPGLLGSAKLAGLPAVRLDPETDAAALSLAHHAAASHIARLGRGLRPFIMRRTKEQVAPELPPRTEETLFCDLEGEQWRTYQQLRQHYLQTLLKKVDQDGLAKSQFQILEALLRLRQAACHTGLLPGRRGGQSAKFDLLLPRLAELIDEGRKALVFSQFTSLLSLLRQRLDADRVAYEYLDGATRDREARVRRFQEDPACPLFLISLKAGGVGLNLTAAEYVFLLDPWWNPAVEMQAIDRTHRIGQEAPVFAYRIVARETVEERILELQAQKRDLADAILEAGTGGLRGLQREDLEVLLG